MRHSNADEIVYASMFFSGLSLIITALSSGSQRSLMKAREYVSIEMNVKSASVLENKKKCKNQVKSIQNGIASLLGLEETLVEVIRPVTIKDGLRLHIDIYGYQTKLKDKGIGEKIQETNAIDDIAQIIKSSWMLSSDPAISNVKFGIHESKQSGGNTVYKELDESTHIAQETMETEIAMSTMKNDKTEKDGEIVPFNNK